MLAAKQGNILKNKYRTFVYDLHTHFSLDPRKPCTVDAAVMDANLMQCRTKVVEKIDSMSIDEVPSANCFPLIHRVDELIDTFILHPETNVVIESRENMLYEACTELIIYTTAISIVHIQRISTRCLVDINVFVPIRQCLISALKGCFLYMSQVNLNETKPESRTLGKLYELVFCSCIMLKAVYSLTVDSVGCPSLGSDSLNLSTVIRDTVGEAGVLSEVVLWCNLWHTNRKGCEVSYDMIMQCVSDDSMPYIQQDDHFRNANQSRSFATEIYFLPPPLRRCREIKLRNNLLLHPDKTFLDVVSEALLSIDTVLSSLESNAGKASESLTGQDPSKMNLRSRVLSLAVISAAGGLESRLSKERLAYSVLSLLPKPTRQVDYLESKAKIKDEDIVLASSWRYFNLYTGECARWKRKSETHSKPAVLERGERSGSADSHLESILTRIFVAPGGSAKNCTAQSSTTSLLQLSSAALVRVTGLSLSLLDHVNDQDIFLGLWLLLVAIGSTPSIHIKELALPILSKLLSLIRVTSDEWNVASSFILAQRILIVVDPNVSSHTQYYHLLVEESMSQLALKPNHVFAWPFMTHFKHLLRKIPVVVVNFHLSALIDCLLGLLNTCWHVPFQWYILSTLQSCVRRVSNTVRLDRGCFVRIVSEILRVRLFYSVSWPQKFQSRDISNAGSNDVELLLDITISTGVLLRNIDEDLWNSFLQLLVLEEAADTPSVGRSIASHVVLLQKAVSS